MTAKTPAERQAAYRARKADTPEVRGAFAYPDDHQAIRDYAAKLQRKREREAKRTSDKLTSLASRELAAPQ